MAVCVSRQKVSFSLFRFNEWGIGFAQNTRKTIESGSDQSILLFWIITPQSYFCFKLLRSLITIHINM